MLADGSSPLTARAGNRVVGGKKRIKAGDSVSPATSAGGAARPPIIAHDYDVKLQVQFGGLAACKVLQGASRLRGDPFSPTSHWAHISILVLIYLFH